VIISCSDSGLDVLHSPERPPTGDPLRRNLQSRSLTLYSNPYRESDDWLQQRSSRLLHIGRQAWPSYNLVLDELQAAAPLWNPKGIVLDFELAELNAVNRAFPTSAQWKQCCHFHFCQCHLRRFKKIPDYTTNQPMKELLNRVYALPFLPVDSVRDGWQDIKQQLLNNHPTATQYVDYVDSTWMDGNYPLSLWNCYDRTLNGEPRTNNVAEGGNNAIRVAFGCSKPVIWKCLDKIKEFQSQTDLILVQHFSGQSNGLKPRRKWVARERRIKSIVEAFNAGTDRMTYLANVGYLFAIKV